MKAIKSLFAAGVAMFACLVGSATPVGTNDAARAVRAWMKRGGMLGAKLGRDVTSVRILSTTNGVQFYSVQTLGGGTVFTSADNTLEPILAFTSEDASETACDPKSPLYALLNRDIVGRATTQSAIRRPALLAAQASSSQVSSKWTKLLDEAAQQEAIAASGVKLLALKSVSSVGDLRVPPLVQTKWGQDTDGYGKPCYNYYTTNNYVCGCVATAMAQIMRYHQWPQSSVPSVTKLCSVNGVQFYCSSLGGVYDWANMPLDPNDKDAATMTADQREAIGKLCYDAGVSVRMDWCDDGSAAYAIMVGEAFRDAFGYGSAYSSDGKGTRDDANGIAKKILSNLGAGYPVLLGISYDYRWYGHAIVGDGYGYNDGTLYVHLNMGWCGQCDVWYQLPDIGEIGDELTYNCLDNIVYNIVPDGSDTKAVLSGRVTLPAGGAASGASVAIRVSGSTTALTNVTANAYGVYGVVLPSGAVYEVRATFGTLSGTTTMESKLSAPKLTNCSFSGYVGTTIVDFSTTKFVDQSFFQRSKSAGNAMNVDVELVEAVSPGDDIDVPDEYESATEFADALNDGTANKADYLKAPDGVATTTDYLAYFNAVPSGEAKVAFVLNEGGTNAVKTAIESVETSALAVALSDVTTLTIVNPLVGFYYSLKQGGAVTNLLFNDDGDRNKLAGRYQLGFELMKPNGAGFYQTIITPTEYVSP